MASKNPISTKKKIKNEKSSGEKVPKPDSAWFNGRMHDLGLNRKALADVFGTDEYMISRMISGRRPVRIPEALTWARTLRVPVTVILKRLGYDAPEATVALVGIMRANGRVSYLPPGQQSTAPAPAENDDRMVAIQVESDQTALAIYHGEILYYCPAEKVDPTAYGRLGVITADGLTSPVVGVLDRGTVHTSRIVLFGGAETLQVSGVLTAAPILWRRA